MTKKDNKVLNPHQNKSIGVNFFQYNCTIRFMCIFLLTWCNTLLAADTKPKIPIADFSAIGRQVQSDLSVEQGGRFGRHAGHPSFGPGISKANILGMNTNNANDVNVSRWAGPQFQAAQVEWSSLLNHGHAQERHDRQHMDWQGIPRTPDGGLAAGPQNSTADSQLRNRAMKEPWHKVSQFATRDDMAAAMSTLLTSPNVTVQNKPNGDVVMSAPIPATQNVRSYTAQVNAQANNVLTMATGSAAAATVVWSQPGADLARRAFMPAGDLLPKTVFPTSLHHGVGAP